MITIIGAGKVGGDAALFSALRRLDDEILLLDIAEGLPQGEAMDLNHMLSEQGIDVNVKGSNNYEDMKGSKIVVVVAGVVVIEAPHDLRQLLHRPRLRRRPAAALHAAPRLLRRPDRARAAHDNA